jgi:hypothetical protein
MEKDASAQLGEPVNAGVLLMASGAVKKMRKQAAIGGLVGTAVTAVLNRREKQGEAADDVIDHEGGAFLAVTPTRVVLFSVVTGKLRQKLGEPVATFRRGDLAAIELGKAAAGVATVDLVLADRRRYCFEISKLFTKKLQPAADALGVPMTG